jgi:hypothetical protein
MQAPVVSLQFRSLWNNCYRLLAFSEIVPGVFADATAVGTSPAYLPIDAVGSRHWRCSSRHVSWLRVFVATTAMPLFLVASKCRPVRSGRIPDSRTGRNRIRLQRSAGIRTRRARCAIPRVVTAFSVGRSSARRGRIGMPASVIVFRTTSMPVAIAQVRTAASNRGVFVPGALFGGRDHGGWREALQVHSRHRSRQ